jgi:peptidoglycan-associated lipoprotein
MKKMSKIAVAALAALVILVLPACKTKRKNIEPTVVPTVTETQAPEVPAPPAPVDTGVTPPSDFVEESTPPEDVRPTEIEALNRWAQQKGYIRDAYFNYDEATLDGAAQEALQTSASWLKGEGNGYNVLLEGHCDERGTEQYNLALGDRRANTAKDYLVTLGVNSGRIRTVSYGEERPFDEGHDDTAWAKNRRAHLVLVQAR